VAVELEARSSLPPDLDVPAARRLSDWLRSYRPLHGTPDELLDVMGRPRQHWLSFLGEFAEYTNLEARSRFELATRRIRDTGVTYRVYGEDRERPWPLSPLPLILDKKEWARIAEGVEQRANLMEAVLQDIYGTGRLVEQGALPAAAFTGSVDYIRAMVGSPPPGGHYLQFYAADIGRGPDGRWWVLDDRTQAPSGAGYALENRLILSRAYPNIYKSMNVDRLAGFFDAFRKGLAAAGQRVQPRICLLTPGPHNETYFEQAYLARYLGFLLVEGADLVARDGRAYVRTIAGLKRADVILRRVDGDFVDPLELNNESRLGTPGMLEAIRAGGVAVLNMPGSGVLESKALMGFLPRLCRRIFGEELKMPNVATWWCGQPRERELVESSLDHMVLAPAFSFPPEAGAGWKPSMIADLAPHERDALRARMRDRPHDFVGQEVVRLSTTPTLRNGALEPAPFVLRVYAARTPDGFKIMPGGFCRTSQRPDVRAISMDEDAQAADVWVIDDEPVEAVTLLTGQENVRPRRIIGHLPSRAADNLYWLGRYLERAEATLRLIRCICASLMDTEFAVVSGGPAHANLRQILVDWGALDDEASREATAVAAARSSLIDAHAFGSVLSLVRNARRAAAGTRERLSAEFWSVLIDVEDELLAGQTGRDTEAAILQRVETALKMLAALAGLGMENMNRTPGWRFLDMGRRLERGINTCRLARAFAGDEASGADLDLLLDLMDSQITYRARYLEGLALIPVRDMVLLDPYNPRSVAFQVCGLKDHLSALPPLLDNGMLEEPMREVLPLATELETSEAAGLEVERMRGLELSLLKLSHAIADRFFQQGANATPPGELAGLA
jgi:uncharacterized circularly permuted ATP-grasp superfamily protein/uncharacterized alpha-E superfamily protein